MVWLEKYFFQRQIEPIRSIIIEDFPFVRTMGFGDYYYAIN